MKAAFQKEKTACARQRAKRRLRQRPKTQYFPNRSFGQSDDVALQSRGFIGELQVEINLVQVGTHAQQNPAGCGRRQQSLLKTVTGLNEVFHAVVFGKQFAAVESVDIQLIGRALEAAEEMAGHPDPGHGQVQTPGQKKIDHAETDRVARAPVDHPVQVAVFRFVVILLVAAETEFRKKILIDRGQDLIGLRAEINPLPQIAGVTVKQRLVRWDVNV